MDRVLENPQRAILEKCTLWIIFPPNDELTKLIIFTDGAKYLNILMLKILGEVKKKSEADLFKEVQGL